MPKLTIGDKTVTVGDEFMHLSPEQQNATVAQIAQQIGIGSDAAPRATAPSHAPSAGGGSMVNDTVRSVATGVPIIGGTLNKLDAATNAALAPLLNRFFAHDQQLPEATFGERYAHSLKDQEAADKRFASDHPVIDTAAQLTGGIVSTIPVMAAAPKAFGLIGSMPEMVKNGALSGAALAGADAITRGDSVGDAAVTGGIIGGAAGPVGKAVGKGVAAIADRVRPPPTVARNVEQVAGVDVPLSQSQVTQSPALSAEEQVILRGGRGDAAQAQAQGFKDLQDQRISKARDAIAAGLDPTGQAARTAPQDAAERVAAELLANEQARRAAAAGVTAGAMSPGQQAADMARAMAPDMRLRAASPIDAGEMLSDRIAAARDAAKAEYRGKYDLVEQQPGEFAPGSAGGFRTDVETGLISGQRPVRLDPTNTGRAIKALDIVDERLNAVSPGRPIAPAPGAAGEAPAVSPNHAQDVADIRAKFGEDVAAAYDRQARAAAAPVSSNFPAPAGANAANPGVSASNDLLTPHSVDVAGGGSVQVAPKVVEASSLKTSADAGYDPALQPRDRSRAASAGQVNDIAQNLNPQRLGRSAEADRGAPIVGPDGMVESGNGRVAAIRQAYREAGPKAQEYRDWLSSQGVDVSGFREPVLIRERTTPMSAEQRQAFAVGANQGATLAMSAPERAISDAKLISGGSLALIKNPADLASIENRDFVRQFAARLPQTEQGAFVNAQGHLSAEGATRVRNAVLAKAYGDSAVLTRIAESTSDDVKSISNALTTAAPEWAALREGVAAGSVPAEMDVTADLLDAVARTAHIRARGAGLSEAMAQTDAFDRQSPISQQIMRLFYDADGKRAASSTQINQALRYYAQEAAKVEASPGLMLGLPEVKAADILDLAALKVAAPKEISPDVLQTAAKAAKAGEKVAAAAAGPASGFTMRDVEQVRKELNTLYGEARRAAMAPGANGSDVYALEHIIEQFDARVEQMISAGKFSGDGPAVLQMQREARASFADYRAKFSRRGPGDTIGAAVEKILGRYSDTRATPDEIAKLAYGSATAPGGQMPVQIAQRIERIFGRKSAEFGTYKQGLFAHLTAGEPDAAAARIRAFLGGKGKLLAQTVFSADERAAIARYADRLDNVAPKAADTGPVASAIRRYTGADGGAPASVNQIVNDLFGATGKGAGRLSVPLAVELKRTLSPEGWTALRQGMFEKLTRAGDGKIEFEAQALSQRLHEFLNESGSQLAKTLYSPQELQLMRKLASVYRQMIPVKGTTNPSGTAPMLARMAGGLRHALLPLLGLTHGGIPGAAVAYGLDKGISAVGEKAAARKATSLFYGQQPQRSANPAFGKASGLIGFGALPVINDARGK
jgi:hypothetical protein